MKNWLPAPTRKAIRSLLAASGLVKGKAPDADYLRRQVRCSWQKESRNLALFGLHDGMTILDLGCGPGHFAECLVEWLPNANVTAVDANPNMIAAARARFANDARVRIVEASAENTTLAGGSFDFVIARLLFQHLKDPHAVVNEAMRVLKPGGRFVVIDDDDGLFHLIEPPVAGFQQLVDAYGRAQAQKGGNRRRGRWLHRFLRDGGFGDIQLEMIATHSDDAGLEMVFPQLDDAPLDWLVSETHITTAERDAYRTARGEFFSSSDAFVIVMLFMVCGTKRSG